MKLTKAHKRILDAIKAEGQFKTADLRRVGTINALEDFGLVDVYRNTETRERIVELACPPRNEIDTHTGNFIRMHNGRRVVDGVVFEYVGGTYTAKLESNGHSLGNLSRENFFELYYEACRRVAQAAWNN